MPSKPHPVVDEWHAGVNAADPARAAATVGDPVVERSGIRRPDLASALEPAVVCRELAATE